MDTYNVLGIRVDSITSKDILSQNKHNLFIATVNSSFILKAQKLQDFKTILNTKTDINTIDSISIQMCLKYFDYCKNYSAGSNLINNILKPFVFIYYGFKSGRVKHLVTGAKRLTGVDLTTRVLEHANKYSKSVLVFHRSDALTSEQELKTFINTNYPNIKLGVLKTNISRFNKPINKRVSYDYVFCTLGEYKQEKFLYVNSKLVECTLKVGVGGAFDVICGKVNISNKQRLNGTEWLHRLLNNPRRTFKILRSVIVFPFKVYFYSLTAL